MPIASEVDGRFKDFVERIGLRADIADKLWKADIRTPQELAGCEQQDVLKITNSSLLSNAILPELQKNVFAITMAPDPYNAAISVLQSFSQKQAPSCTAMEVDPSPKIISNQAKSQSDAIMSDITCFVDDEKNAGTDRNTSNIPVAAMPNSNQTRSTEFNAQGQPIHEPPLEARNVTNQETANTTTGNRSGDYYMNRGMAVGAKGTGTNRVYNQQNQRYYENDSSGAAKGNKIVITGGNFVQANMLGKATYHNVSSHIVTSLSDGDAVEVRRKNKLNSNFYLNGEMVPTAELLWREGEFWLDKLDVHTADMEQYDQHFADDSIYKVNNWGQSQAMILNNIKFGPGVSERKGADKDSHVMKTLAEQLGFEVDLKENKSKNQMLQAFREFTKSSKMHKCSMVLVYLGSHGERDANGNDILLGADNAKVRLSDIMDMFSNENCPALRGKPKLFFIQACRKDNANSTTQASQGGNVQQDTVPVDNSRAMDHVQHRISDMLKAFSTLPGQQAYRDTTDGSWFVTALAKVFEEYACKEDLLSILTRANNLVSRNTGKEGRTTVVQLSEISSSLTKKVYFYPQSRSSE